MEYVVLRKLNRGFEHVGFLLSPETNPSSFLNCESVRKFGARGRLVHADSGPRRPSRRQEASCEAVTADCVPRPKLARSRSLHMPA